MWELVTLGKKGTLLKVLITHVMKHEKFDIRIVTFNNASCSIQRMTQGRVFEMCCYFRNIMSFGALFYSGGTPYPTINNRELLRLLKGGYRMEKPDICNDEM